MKFAPKTMFQIMTPTPKVIGPNVLISQALEIMRRERIRHLPVVSGKRVVGILSDKNAKAIALTKAGGNFQVKDVMMPNPYIARPNELLEDVLTQMINKKYGSAVIQGTKKEVVGIFTTIDALWMLREFVAVKRKKRIKLALVNPHAPHAESIEDVR